MFNDSLDGYQPNRTQEQNIAFKKLAGDVRQLRLKDFMAVMEISHHSIGSIQVRDEELTLLQCQRLAFLAMALRKKQLNSKLFSQGPFAHIQRIVNGSQLKIVAA